MKKFDAWSIKCATPCSCKERQLIHDPNLLEALSSLNVIEFDGRVFRVAGKQADPIAFSQSGGRWAMDTDKEGGCPILYTSTHREGAIAEVASYLGLLTPVPLKPLKLHELEVSLDRTLRLAVTDFAELGINESEYSARNYERTQRVGAAVNFLELDGLFAPSARWNCANLMIYGDNHKLEKKLEVIQSIDLPYDEWKIFAEHI